MPYVFGSKKGEITNVAPVAGYDSTAILGIADNGTLVGSATDDTAMVTSGVLVDKQGAATTFDHPDAVSFTQARGANSNGLVAGFGDINNDPSAGLLLGAFIYDSKKGTFTDIVPSLQTIAHDVNSRGDVVGSAIFLDFLGYPDPCGTANAVVQRGWLRTADGDVTYYYFEDANGAEWRTTARGLTDSGTIAGWVRDPADFSASGYTVDLDGSQCQAFSVEDTGLLDVPGAVNTYAQGIKNSGEIVGSYDDGNFTAGGGFVATPQ